MDFSDDLSELLLGSSWKEGLCVHICYIPYNMYLHLVPMYAVSPSSLFHYPNVLYVPTSLHAYILTLPDLT